MTKTATFLTREKAQHYGRRGAAAYTASRGVIVYIDGQPYGYADIAARFGITGTAAHKRVKKARTLAAGKPLTWDMLGEPKK